MIPTTLLNAKINSNKARMQAAEMAVDFYSYAQHEYMEEIIKYMYPNTHQEIINYIECQDLTKQIIDDSAILFQRPASFSIETENEALDELFHAVLDDAELYKKLIAADRYTELLHKVGLAVHWHEADKRVVIDILTPDLTFVEQDPQDPTKAVRVYYQIGQKTDTMLAEPVNVFGVWDIDSYREVELNRDFRIIKTLKTIPNPYGRIPIVWLVTKPEVNSFWIDGGYPIVAANVNINLRETNLDMALDYQTISTLVTKGLDAKSPFATGVTRRIDLPPNHMGSSNDADAYYITPAPMLDQVGNIIQSKRVNIAKQAGLSAESFTRDTSQMSSGYQLRLSKQDILNKNELKKELYREPIRQLIRNMLDCYSYNADTVFPADLRIGIDFAEVVFDSNPLEIQQRRAMEQANGTASRVDHIMEDNPDLTREDAIEVSKRIDTENSQFGLKVQTQWTPLES